MLSVQACNQHPPGSSGLSKVHTRRCQTVPSMIFTHLTRVSVCVSVSVRAQSWGHHKALECCVVSVCLCFPSFPSHVCFNEGVGVGHERRRQRGELVLAVGAGAELADVWVQLAVPLLPLSEGLRTQAGVLQEGTDHSQLRLFGLPEQRVAGKIKALNPLLSDLFVRTSCDWSYLQGAAEGSDPVEPVVEQRVSGSLGKTAPKLLSAAGFGVAQGRHVGLL